ncbi:MAG: exonuclease domain-containing protein [Bacteroidota bacterium]
MQLQLKKPLCFIDLETTGVNVGSDRIVEISILKLHPDGKKEVWTKRINPGMHIPEEASNVHGIYDADVANENKFEELADQIKFFLDDCDLAGYNSNKFDIPLLLEEFLRCHVEFDISERKLIDVQNIFHKMEQRTLAAAYKFYCHKELENAHSAEADILATHEVLEAQLEKYNDLQKDVNFLHEFSKPKNAPVDFAGRIVLNDYNVPVFNFGKHKGKSVEEVFRSEPSYYNWMMQGDFPLYTKKVITEIKQNM